MLQLLLHSQYMARPRDLTDYDTEGKIKGCIKKCYQSSNMSQSDGMWSFHCVLKPGHEIMKKIN